jgi:hypothetical protein
MTTSKHVEDLEKLRALLRSERRSMAAKCVVARRPPARRDLIEFGNLQRSFEAIDDAIQDENNEAEAEAAHIRSANQPEPQRYDTESLDHDDGPQ